MQSRVYVTVGRPSVPSIDSSNGGFAAERPAGRRYRSIAAGAVLQASALTSKLVFLTVQLIVSTRHNCRHTAYSIGW